MGTKLKNKKILITCGPTWVPIDDVRVISNRSTGELGQTLASEFIQTGANVTLLEGPVTEALKNPSIKVSKFCFYNELVKLLKDELQNKKYDIVIHAAAVSDYQLKKLFKNKISSQLENLTLELIPTPKIISLIKKLSPESFLVGFKLEPSLTPTLAQKFSRDLFKKSQCDLVVANSSHEDQYHAFILNNKNQILSEANIRKNLAKILTQTILSLTGQK